MLQTILSFRKIFLWLVMISLYSGVSAANTKNPAVEQPGVIHAVNVKDSLQIVRLINRARQEIEEDNSLQAKIKFFATIENVIHLARKTGWLVMTGKKINRVGEQLRREARYPLALWLHKKSIEIGKETGNARLLIVSYNDLGVVFRRIDSYKKAMEYHLKALRLATQTHDSASIAIAVNSIGNVNLMLGEYDKALQYFKNHEKKYSKKKISLYSDSNYLIV